MRHLHTSITVLLCLWITVGAFGVQAGTSADNPGNLGSKTGQVNRTGPVAELPSPVFEFSPVIDGTEILHDFVIRNTGNAELRIKQIKTG